MLTKGTIRNYKQYRANGCTASEALEYARADKWAYDNDVRFEWERDTDSPISSWRDLKPGETDWYGWSCVARHHETAESVSLCGIHFADGEAYPQGDFYHRIVEAELAAELRGMLADYVDAR